MKQHQAMIQAVKKNDTVVTGGGLVGKVTKVDEAEVEVEIAHGVRVKALKSTLSDVRPHGAKPANDYGPTCSISRAGRSGPSASCCSSASPSPFQDSLDRKSIGWEKRVS